jgi:hypothetical protein
MIPAIPMAPVRSCREAEVGKEPQRLAGNLTAAGEFKGGSPILPSGRLPLLQGQCTHFGDLAPSGSDDAHLPLQVTDVRDDLLDFLT